MKGTSQLVGLSVDLVSNSLPLDELSLVGDFPSMEAWEGPRRSRLDFHRTDKNSMMRIATRTWLTLGALAAAGTAQAQTASAILREGDPVPGGPVGHIVDSLSSTRTNNNGGYVLSLNSTDGVTTLSHAWGAANGSSPTVLQTEATIGPLVQTSFESFMGLSNLGQISYSASGTGGPVGGFDSAWLDSTPIAVEGDPHPTLPGQFWRFASRPGITADATPYFVAGLTSTAGGGTENRGLFFGASGTPLVLGGTSLTNLPEPLSTSASVSFDYGISALGTNHIVEVQMAGPSVTTSSDNAVAINGAGLMLGGSLVQEGVLVPVAVGGDGTENWDNLDFHGINEAGDYFFTGDTDAAITTTDEIVVYNGTIRFREGDTVDGAVLTGGIENACMNESGDLALVWDIEDGLGGSLEALFFEDSLVLAEGDEVDWDGDGNVDAGFVIDSFSGLAGMCLASDGVIYFTAEIDMNGAGTMEGFFSTAGVDPFTPYCFGDGSDAACPCGNLGTFEDGCQNSTSEGGDLDASGTPDVMADTVVLHASQVPNNVPGIFFQGNTDLGSGNLFGDGLLCAGNGIKRLELVFATPGGSATSTVSISTVGAVNAGDLRFYQYWFRDVAGPCNSGFNTTNGVSVQW